MASADVKIERILGGDDSDEDNKFDWDEEVMDAMKGFDFEEDLYVNRAFDVKVQANLVNGGRKAYFVTFPTSRGTEGLVASPPSGLAVPRVTRSRTRLLQSLQSCQFESETQVEKEPPLDEVPTELHSCHSPAKNVWICETCQHAFSRRSNLLRHGSRGCRNKCRNCGLFLGSLIERRIHAGLCLVCDTCGHKPSSSASRFSDLLKHVRRCHSDRLPAKCDATKCEK